MKNKEVNTYKKVMVCVTRQKNCERLVKAGEKIALKRKEELIVIHVAKTGDKFMGDPHEGAVLDFLFRCAKNAQAEMHIIRADDIVSAIEKFAKEQDVSVIVLGSPPPSESSGGLTYKVMQRLTDVKFEIL